jgi:hypothetical protein
MLQTIKPKAGKRVVFPRSRRVLKDAGERVEIDTYWRRRIIDGDCELISPPEPKKATRARTRAPDTQEE